MDSEQTAELAALNRHKKFMLLHNYNPVKKRYIEVFQCSSADMTVVLTNPELPTTLQIPGMNMHPFNNGLPPVLNQLTPPGMSAQTSPQQGSPPAGSITGLPPPPFGLPGLHPLISPQQQQRLLQPSKFTDDNHKSTTSVPNNESN